MKNLEKTALELVNLYRRNGSLRLPNEARFEEGSDAYKKGYEIRFVANDEAEAAHIAQLLDEGGFKWGKIYPKRSHQFILPVYGYDAMMRFQELLKTHPPVEVMSAEVRR